MNETRTNIPEEISFISSLSLKTPSPDILNELQMKKENVYIDPIRSYMNRIQSKYIVKIKNDHDYLNSSMLKKDYIRLLKINRQKTHGNKKQLKNRWFAFIYFKKKIQIIKRALYKYFRKLYCILRDEYINYTFINTIDCITQENINNYTKYELIFIQPYDNSKKENGIFVFYIESIVQLLKQHHQQYNRNIKIYHLHCSDIYKNYYQLNPLKNPLNREIISWENICKVSKKIRYMYILQFPLEQICSDIHHSIGTLRIRNNHINNVNISRINYQSNEFRNYVTSSIIQWFLYVQNLTQLIIEPRWLLDLNNQQCIQLYIQLDSIWFLQDSTLRRNICPPNGNPFIPCQYDLFCSYIDPFIQKWILYQIISNMVQSTSMIDLQIIGSYVVLGSLAFIHQEIANTFPFLTFAFFQ